MERQPISSPFAAYVITASGLFGTAAVALAAAGAHAFKARLSVDDYATYETAVTMGMLHAVLLFGCGVALQRGIARRSLEIAAAFLLLGILLFSGGLIGRVVLGMPDLGRLAPTGGTALILAWLSISCGGLIEIWRKT